RVENTPAVVALVATSVCVATVRTGAFNVAVGQETAVGGTIGRLHSVFEDIAVIVEREKEILRDAIVVFGASLGIQIPGHTKLFPDFADLPVVACHELLWRDAFAVGVNENRRAMLIATRDH